VRYVVYDAETRGVSSLKQTGSHIYLCDPVTDVLCVSYCIVVDGVRGPISTWLPSQPIPAEILEAAADPATLIVSFNDAFERQLEEHILHPRYGWPIFSIERRRCAQAIALTHALPASLDAAAEALKLTARKTAAGKRAMKLLAQPRKPRNGEDPSQIYWHDDPKQVQILHDYNHIDVEITAEIVARLGFIPPQEQLVWQLDAQINARGIRLDAELLDAAISIGEQAGAELKQKIAALTDGEVTSPSQVDRILKWLARQRCELENIQEKTLLEALKRPELQPAARQLINFRLDGAHAAARKLETLRRWLAPDQRVRHVYRYHGAMPGRFTSIGAQMQNLKKPTVVDVGAAIEAVRSASLANLQRYERPLAVVGDMARALVIAAPGHRLFIADLSGIESRGLAWLCNESAKLEAWRDFDRTGDPQREPYYRFATEDLKLTGDKARGTGKTADLAFGYGGSLGAWRRLAPADTDEEVIRSFRQAWVRAHPNIEKFWATSVRQAANAIENPGQRCTVARITFIRENQFLYLELPSGRRLSYPFARIYDDDHGKTFTFRDASGGRWAWYHVLKQRGAFGGLIAENATQALCRDIFVAAMLRLEAAGYPVVAHLHDEVVCEVPDGTGDIDEFRNLITAAPAWAPDFPIAAKARIADRFIESKSPKAAAPAEDIAAEPEAEPPPENIHKPEALEVEELNLMRDKSPRADMPPPEFDDPPPHEQSEQASNGSDHDYAAGEQPHGAPTIRYVYKDAQGRLYMRVNRCNGGARGKSFSVQHWHGGRWVSGWPAVAIPYRLPELLAAAPGEPIWICEGEKDCDNVAALGLIATTNAGGAGKWQPELAQYFKGKELVYVVEDNDDAGRAHSEKIQKALAEIVPAIAVVSFPELPDKGDVSDWLKQGGNKQLLLARAEQAQKRTATSDNTIEPINLWGQFDPPPLPSGLLPEVIEQFAREEGELTGADPAGFAAAALAVCAAALPDHTQVQVKRHDPNWREAARLWVALIGDPSSKKSPIMLRAAKPLVQLDIELWRQFLAEQECYEKLSVAERKGIEQPKQQRLRLEDTTIEGAQELLKDSPNGVLCLQDELGGWFGAMDKYSGRGAAKDRGFWLQAFRGGSCAVNRIARGAFVIPNLSVSLLGGIQPDPARRIADDTVDDGLLQRLIPIILRHGRVGKDEPTGRAGRRYDELIVRLHERKHPGAPLQFDDAALAVRQELERRYTELRTYEAMHRKLVTHLGKYDGIFARLCLLWHAIEQAEGLIIAEPTALRVAEFMHRFLLPHAMSFYAGVLALSDDHDRLTQVAGYILAKKLSRVTNRDVQRGNNAMRGLERQDIERVFDQLEALGWLMPTPSPYRSKPPHWEVNPEVHRRFAARGEREATERAKQRALIQEMFRGER
jgi:Protein of unknown function (DUF3987)